MYTMTKCLAFDIPWGSGQAENLTMYRLTNEQCLFLK